MASEDGEGLVLDPVFLALTRPPMALGVTYGMLVANVVVTIELFLLSHSLLALLACLPLHGVAWMLCAIEPRFLDLVQGWGRARAVGGWRGRARWGVVAYAPLPALPRASRREGVSVALGAVAGQRMVSA